MRCREGAASRRYGTPNGFLEVSLPDCAPVFTAGFGFAGVVLGGGLFAGGLAAAALLEAPAAVTVTM
jgi:hypothetical protein